MNQMTPPPRLEIIPPSAPFTDGQRSWLNGFLVGLLQLDGALNGIDRAGEFNQHPVAHDFHDAPFMERDQGIEDAPSAIPQCGKRARLILLDEPAVADDVGGQDCGELALHGRPRCKC